MRPVLTKNDFVRRYIRGEFGNRAPSWGTLDEFQSSGYRGKVHIRNRVANGLTWYNIESSQVLNHWVELVTLGVSPDSLYLSGMAPHDYGSIQGEFQQSVHWMDLTYCDAKLPMREAMAVETSVATGVTALCLLKKNMDPVSYDWSLELMNLYPGHVIEFSCFGVSWGTIPHRNTVIWEVRNY